MVIKKRHVAVDYFESYEDNIEEFGEIVHDIWTEYSVHTLVVDAGEYTENVITTSNPPESHIKNVDVSQWYDVGWIDSATLMRQDGLFFNITDSDGSATYPIYMEILSPTDDEEDELEFLNSKASFYNNTNREIELRLEYGGKLLGPVTAIDPSAYQWILLPNKVGHLRGMSWDYEEGKWEILATGDWIPWIDPYGYNYGYGG